ncbi:response regulator transcription factor [Neobacillus sp. PS3-40]|jgi:two-component system, NarL family, nitrate/nitrite response regulator NarL|uniref:response regulator transcription factor n=1 Tax=Neobacillus sp. PS3-40 TaxID=3070679 RepID=UPI0027DF9869|nr:response regulator transcription factor [Neobacillus sp. PS3-40]WML45272.1 response regulator transcription factor [Neobacillus sp. PS3-40]
MNKIKVLIADDHYMFIRGIESILSDDESIQIVGKAQNGQEAYEMAKQFSPNVILMDVNMPVMDGLQAMKMIIKEMPKVKVLMLTVNDKEEQLFEALRSGAKGYLLKNLLPNELLTFIHMVNRGESILTGPIVGKVLNYFSDHPQIEPQIMKTGRKTDILTKREKEILMQVMKGMTNREIAHALFISENTVKNHLRNIMEKLQMSNRVQAATFALKEGWLQEL